jgi:hypothetical protein
MERQAVGLLDPYNPAFSILPLHEMSLSSAGE